MKKLISVVAVLFLLVCFFPEAKSQQTLTPIQFNKISYVKDGKPFYLISGEFHYFRVPKADWKKRMELLKQAGGNCLATYVPWLIHEPKEGTFDFGSEGFRDLEGFLQLAKEMNLYVIARPGPYQYTELNYDGLPGWLCENYPELRATTIDGKDYRKASISYQHPLFLKKVKTWYDKVIPMLAKYTVTHGGPIAFLQLDNELTGVHFWNRQLDYNPETMGFGKKNGKFPLFLAAKYKDIATLNKSYGSSSTAFEDVKPIDRKTYDKPEELRQLKDYYDFYFSMCAEYLDTLAVMARTNGIDIPLVHNAANPEMVPYFKETVQKIKQPFVLGLDSYYNIDQNWGQNNPTPQYAARIYTGLEMLRLMGYPASIFEIPSITVSDWPPITAKDAKAAYMLSLAYGMKGHNYYIYTGGKNPMGYGSTGDDYDFNAPVGPNNVRRPIYYAQQEVAAFVNKNNWLPNATKVHDCRIALDFEYARSDNYWKSKAGYLFSSPDAWKMTTKGILSTALCASISAEFCDLSNADFMKDKTPLIVVSSVSMPADKQRNIVEFLKQGGNVILMPIVPSLDENFNACTILSDYIGKLDITTSKNFFSRASFGTNRNVIKDELFMLENIPANAEVLGKDEISGNTIACKLKTQGGGTLIWCGMTWIARQNQQGKMLSDFLNDLGYQQRVFCDNPNIWASMRTDGNHSMLFLMNLFTSEQTANIQYVDNLGKLINLGKVKVDEMNVKPIMLK